MRILALFSISFCHFVVWAPAPMTGQTATAGSGRVGYLSRTELDGVSKAVPLAPKKGSIRDRDDQAIFRETRALRGSSRWSLAQRDDAADLKKPLRNFACAMNAEIEASAAPKLSSLLAAALADTNYVSGMLKQLNERPRPYLAQKGPVCVSTDPLEGSFDYPSGHAGFGWTLGLILAELIPERSSQILMRAKAYGESRVVCGVHNASAVEAGMVTASVVVAALHGSNNFRADLDAARVELAAIAAKPQPSAQGCASEEAALAKQPY